MRPPEEVLFEAKVQSRSLGEHVLSLISLVLVIGNELLQGRSLLSLVVAPLVVLDLTPRVLDGRTRYQITWTSLVIRAPLWFASRIQFSEIHWVEVKDRTRGILVSKQAVEIQKKNGKKETIFVEAPVEFASRLRAAARLTKPAPPEIPGLDKPDYLQTDSDRFRWRSAALTPPHQVLTEPMKDARFAVGVAGLAVLMAIGVLQPWVVIEDAPGFFGPDDIEVAGTEFDLGVVTLLAAVTGAGFCALRAFSGVHNPAYFIFGFGVGALCTAIPLWFVLDIESAASFGWSGSTVDHQSIRTGWGAYSSTAVSIGFLLSLIWHAFFKLTESKRQNPIGASSFAMRF